MLPWRRLNLVTRYTPKSESYFDRMSVKPGTSRLVLMNSFITSIVNAGVVGDLDLLYLLDGETSQASLLNIAREGFDLAAPGTMPTFAANEGFTGVPASSTTLVASGYNPATGSGLKFSINDACAGLWTRTPSTYDGVTSRIDLFMGTGTVRLQRRNSADVQYAYRINDGTSRNIILSGGTAQQVGHFTTMRTGASARALYRNASSIDTDTQASNAVSTTFALFGTTGGYSDCQASLAYAGKALSAAKLTALHDAATIYRTAVEALP